jgi:hypothetical protein
MTDEQKTPEMDVEGAFSEEEKAEIRSHIDALALENRIAPEQASFDRKSAKPGYLIPLLINAGAIIAILVGVLILRSAFSRQDASVRAESVEFTSIEGRLIRELRAESQQEILAKEQEIELVRRQLAELEEEQEELDANIEARLAEREAELRAQLEQEIAIEQARLIAEGIEDAELEDLLQAFEAERRAFYEQQLAQYREELEVERVALQNEIDALRTEYQNRLTELETERREIVDQFRQREADLRVQLEQRTRVLEIARVEATADLEAAQRELNLLERQQENSQAIEDQIIGQIESIQGQLQDGNDAAALAEIDALISFLSQDEVLQIAGIARRREMDIFLLRQLRALVEDRVALKSEGDRSITQELRFLSEIRSLSQAAAGAPSEEAQRQAFATLLETLPEVAQAHEAVVTQSRSEAIEEARESERSIVTEGAASAETLAAQGAYDAAAQTYVEALQALPSIAPDAERMLSEMLRLGYAMTDYVVDGEESAQVNQIAQRADIDLESERRAFEEQVERAIAAAVGREDAGLSFDIAERGDQIATLEDEVDRLNRELELLTGAQSTEGASREELAARVEALQQERDTLQSERDRLAQQREQLVSERAALRTRYAEYATAQEAAIASGDFVALANARDAFFLSPEIELFLDGLGDLLDQYEQQQTVERSRIGLDVRDVSEIVEELSADLTEVQREALLENAVSTAQSDGNAPMVEFLSLLAELIDTLEPDD